VQQWYAHARQQRSAERSSRSTTLVYTQNAPRWRGAEYVYGVARRAARAVFAAAGAAPESAARRRFLMSYAAAAVRLMMSFIVTATH